MTSVERPPQPDLDHLGLSVTDVDRSTRFHCGLLGAEVVFARHELEWGARTIVRLGNHFIDLNELRDGDGRRSTPHGLDSTIWRSAHTLARNSRSGPTGSTRTVSSGRRSATCGPTRRRILVLQWWAPCSSSLTRTASSLSSCFSTLGSASDGVRSCRDEVCPKLPKVVR